MTDIFKSSNQRLLGLSPRTGMLVKSNGDVLNQADFLELRMLADNNLASRLGYAYRAFYFNPVMPASTTYNLILNIPEGIKLIGLTRTTTIREGTVEDTFGVATGFTGNNYSMLGYNFDEMLDDRSEASLVLPTSVSGFSARTPPNPNISPSTGAVRTPSTQTISAFEPTFDSTHLPVFRYQNMLNNTVWISVQLTWQELPK
jgi:hypothetical protein